MSASERHFTSIQELMKNALFMKQQIRYESLRRCQLVLLWISTWSDLNAFDWLSARSLSALYCFLYVPKTTIRAEWLLV